MEIEKEKPDFKKAIDIKAFFYKKLGACSCSCSEMEPMLLEIKTLLEWGCSDIDDRKSYENIYNNKGIFYIIAGIMNTIGLLEHGTSIRCAWTTLMGMELLEGLKTFSFDKIANSEGDAYNGCCYFS